MAKELILINNVWTLRAVETPADFYRLIYRTDFLSFAETNENAAIILSTIRTPISGTIL